MENLGFFCFFEGDSADHEDNKRFADLVLSHATVAVRVPHFIKLSSRKLLENRSVEPRLVLEQHVLDVFSEH
jgi:hypothetical protein